MKSGLFCFEVMERLLFMSLASGSSGNCYYVGTASRGILIDVGVPVRTIQRRLRAVGLDWDNVLGVFITHDHADHVRSVGALSEEHHLPVFATQSVHQGIDRNYGVSPKISQINRRYIVVGEPLDILGFTITSFPVPHDATECVGYTVEYNGINFTLATDVGEPTSVLAEQVAKADYLVIEANHDEDLLARGSYPLRLKQRISSSIGHMSNATCANFLVNNVVSRLKHVYLCHLSKENNNPELAYTVVRDALSSKQIKVGVTCGLTVLERTAASKLYELI